MRYRVVFDSNVIISAIGWKGKPRDCLMLARAGIVQGLTCWHILEEVRQKLIAKLGLFNDESTRYIDELTAFLEVIETTGSLQGICEDPKDAEVLECALVGAATHILTGDKRHLLPMKQFEGIPIVSPAEFLRIVENDLK
jgi:putative PIN family toxin of toxin-antitoxin system